MWIKIDYWTIFIYFYDVWSGVTFSELRKVKERENYTYYACKHIYLAPWKANKRNFHLFFEKKKIKSANLHI